ncbi:DUF4861 family protein [Thalassotalea litorea]|uniref:DUF4861 family protein n=1 Tax=Thalassotalea litorea TaxID=2020715 RepID=UPI00373560A0
MVNLKFQVMSCFVIFFSQFSVANEAGNWQEFQFVAKNKLDIPVTNAEICLPKQELPFPAESVFVVSGSQGMDHQSTDCNGDFETGDIQLLLDFEANESKSIIIYFNPETASAHEPSIRTQAELAVRVSGKMNDEGRLVGGTYLPVNRYTLPQEHTLGDHLFKYEGIGLESNLMAYRYYFDHRGSLDVFGKSTEKLVLPVIGIDGSNYHEMNDWGMDVLKVGDSFGLGTPGAMQQDSMTRMSQFESLQVKLHSGVNSSAFELSFDNWQIPADTVNATVQYAINHGDSKVKVTAVGSKTLEHWLTGIVNHGLSPIIYDAKDSTWGYFATYGKQSLAGDNLGLAIFFKTEDLVNQVTDENSHTLILGKDTNTISYYFLADWQGGIGGSDELQQFKVKLAKEITKLNSPIQVIYQD